MPTCKSWLNQTGVERISEVVVGGGVRPESPHRHPEQPRPHETVLAGQQLYAHVERRVWHRS